MRAPRTRRPFPAAMLLLALAAPPAGAQEPRVVVAVAAGASFDADLTPGLAVQTTLEPGVLGGAQLEWYPGAGAVGVRGVGLFARRALEEGSGEYTLVTGELGLVTRAGARPSLGGLSPFAAVTVGATRYGATDGSPPLAEGAFGDDPVTRIHLSPSAGLDRALSRRVGLRIEGGDRIVFPGIGESPGTAGTPVAHIPFVLLGVQLRFGAGGDRPVVAAIREADERVAPEAPADTAAPAPAVPPARPDSAAPEPRARPDSAPPPPPTREPAPPPPAEPPAPDEGEGALFTVQVGDFIEPATAERWEERLRDRAIPAWRIEREIQGTTVARLRAGAAPNRDLALALAALIEREFGWPVSVRSIESGEPVPPDAVALTRSALGGP